MEGAPRHAIRGGVTPTERSLVLFAAALTVVVHGAIVFALARFDRDTVVIEPAPPASPRGAALCRGHLRCPSLGWPRPRMGLDEPPWDVIDIQLVAAVVPRLGAMEQDPKKLPKLEMYEQPELVPDGVNIEKDNPEPEQPPLKAPEARPEKRDRKVTTPRRLDRILGELDDDPRRRATHLSRIVGNPGGSVYGTGTEFQEGNAWAGQVQVALHREFRVPSSIDEATLRRLTVEIAIRRINARGEIERYEVTTRSTNGAFNTAAVQVIQRFMPAEGGTERLPVPEPKVLEYVNRHGLLVELNGRMFRR